MNEQTERCVAIIPARGGSKGLPRKNVLPLAGRPLIAWTIDAALRAERVGRVIVSTDDPEIASIGGRYGAEVIMRPESISGDLASSEDALLHALNALQEDNRGLPETLAFLQCTSPLTEPADIDGTVALVEDGGADTALAAVDFHYFLWREDKTEGACGINHDKSVRQMRQERDPQFLESGAVYAMRTDGFMEHRHRFFGRTALHEMPLSRRLEIDEPVDFEMAEVLLRARLRSAQRTLLPDPVEAVIFDFDGVWTDNRVLVREDGIEAVMCDRGDGMGLGMLKKAGIPALVMSKERNPVVAARCAKLGVQCLQAIDDKRSALTHWLKERGHSADRCVYVGNDVNDAEPLKMVGCGVVVADGHADVLPLASIVLTRRGGDGAVRELCDMILQKTRTM